MRLPIGIYHRAGEIVFFGRRRRGKDIPSTRWAPITAPAQRALLDRAEDFRLLEYSGGRVRRRSSPAIAAIRQADLEAADQDWIRAERQAALVEVLVDELAKLGGTADAAAIESEYLAELATQRGS